MIQYILFDKDGTLLDFEAFWGAVTLGAVRDILQSVGVDLDLTEEVMTLYGYEDGVADITGLFAGGTYEMIAEATHKLLTEKGYKLDYDHFYQLLKDKFHEHSEDGELKATCDDIQGLFQDLTDRGIRCAVVTSDDSIVAKQCLDDLGITEYFDEIYAADGDVPAKPDPYYINKICREKGVSKDEILMVGDTIIDAQFAKNGGVKLCSIAKNEKNRKTLEPMADFILHDISGIPAILDAMLEKEAKYEF